MPDDEESRLDRKIRHETLLRDIEPLWDALDSAVKRTCDKLTAVYNSALTSKLNDHSSAIRVKYLESLLPAEHSQVERTLEIRIVRDDKLLVVRITKQHSRSQRIEDESEPLRYRINADIDANTLYFADSTKKRYTPVELAEELVVKKLVKREL
jgi:hypothetical protein